MINDAIFEQPSAPNAPLLPLTVTKAEPLLRSGINITNRAELKYARAVHLANELRGRIDEWSAAETLRARINRVDDHTIEFRMVVRREPPIDEWSLILGDALHNLRSTFDTLMWAMATLDGAEPKTPTRVTFPLTKDEADWEERIKTLESVPRPYLERLKQLQPWVDGVERDESMLWLLHRFDIADKHKGLISGALHFRQLSAGGLELNFEPPATAAQAKATMTMLENPARLESDAVLTTIRCDTHTLNPDPDYMATVSVQFALATDDGRHVLLDRFLGDVISRTRQWLDLIYGGELHAKALKQARESTVPNVMMGYEDESGELHVTHLPFRRLPER